MVQLLYLHPVESLDEGFPEDSDETEQTLKELTGTPWTRARSLS
jgi:hypothetical protein